MFFKSVHSPSPDRYFYFIESEGEAVVIDLFRQSDLLHSLLSERKATLKYIFQTRFLPVPEECHQAPVVLGPVGATTPDQYPARDGEVFTAGKLAIRVLHTPGHSPEAVCYLLYDEAGKPYALFAGDSLFPGKAGSPYLPAAAYTEEILAGMWYDALNTKIKTLPDDVLVCEAHGADTVRTDDPEAPFFSNLGQQKYTNYLLRENNRQAFITAVCENLIPRYDKMYEFPFPEHIPNNQMKALSLHDFIEKSTLNQVVILDTRHAAEFEKGFIPESLNVGLEGQYAVWVGTLVDITRPLLLVCEPGQEAESIQRLLEIGYENILGYLAGGFETWQTTHQETESIESIDADELRNFMREHPDAILLDVRKKSDFLDGHLAGATHISLADLPARQHDFEPSRKYLVYCGGGYRSMIAVSLLKIFGVDQPTSVNGGFGAITAEAGIEIEKPARKARHTTHL